MSRLDEYRAKAEYCHEMAAKVISPLDKDAWLQEATNWRTLASLSGWEYPAAAEMNVEEIWETLASRLSKGTDKA